MDEQTTLIYARDVVHGDRIYRDIAGERTELRVDYPEPTIIGCVRALDGTACDFCAAPGDLIEIAMVRVVARIGGEIRRLGAGGGDGIEVEAHPAGVRVYDTQVSAVYDPAEALAALRAVGESDIDPEDGGGFGAAWQALARLQEVGDGRRC